MWARFLLFLALPFVPISAFAQSCTKAVSFALADAGGVHPFMGTGNWIGKWVEKNAKKYPDICFNQSPLEGRANYLVVLSQSAGYLTGFDAVVRTDTSTSSGPVSGSGTVRNNYGSSWNYTYNGTATTTTTTTSHDNVPYTIRTNTIFAYAYRADGAIVSRRYHVFSSRSGGDASSTAGYNIGSALSTINARGRLINSVVKDVTDQPPYNPPSQEVAKALAPSNATAPALQVSVVAPPEPTPAPACKPYLYTGEKEFISENADGKILILSDGSMWEVSEIDTIDSALWLVADDVVVMRADNPIGCFDHIIINASEHAEKAQAKYLGQR
jgi:hypothetical protein